MDYSDLQTALKTAFDKKDNLGRAFFPYLSEPITIDGFTIPGGVIVFFSPSYSGLYPPWAIHKHDQVVRSADDAVIALGDPWGSCIRVTPLPEGGLKVKVRNRSRTLPKSLQQHKA